MTESTPAEAPEVVRRFAELVTLFAERPTAAPEQRALVKQVVAAAKKSPGAKLTVGEGGALLADGRPADLPLLAKRFKSYGVEELTFTAKVAVADLLDLARMLAAEPLGSDPAGGFAGRVAVIDARALTLRLRPRESGAVAPPVAGLSAPSRPSRASVAARRSTPARPTEPVSPTATPTGTPTARARPSGSTPIVESDSGETARLDRAIPVPESKEPALAAAIARLAAATTSEAVSGALEQMVTSTDLAFRQGRHRDMVDALTAIIAIEYKLRERGENDELDLQFSPALKRLTKTPMLLRQVAVLRHQMADDADAVAQLQAILHRYGKYGADAMADEYASARTMESRAICLEALRQLRRTHDAMLEASQSANLLDVRHAATILGELRDARSEEILADLLHHEEERARRAAVAALGRFSTPSALDALGLALGDESAAVRLRVVAALSGRSEPRVFTMLAPLLDGEPDAEVHYSAIGAIGRLGTPEAVQLLIRTAQGEGPHPHRKSATLRVMACRALVAIRTPTAMAAVQVLRDDRDGEVREASMRLVAQAQRRSTATSQAVVAIPS